MVCLADKSAAPQKSYSQQHYFQILSTFLYDILLAISWPTPYGSRLKQFHMIIYILTHSSIDLKWIVYVLGYMES